MSSSVVSTVIVGGGPAGFAPLFAAATNGCLEALLKGGIVLLHAEEELGAGSLRHCAIRSDSAATAFLDILLQTKEPRLASLLSHPTTKLLKSLRHEPAPLSLVANFLTAASGEMAALVAASSRGAVLTGCVAFRVSEQSSGLWCTEYLDKRAGTLHKTFSLSVVLATGGKERVARSVLAGEEEVDLAPYTGKIRLSQSFLRHDGHASFQALVHGKDDAKIVILGSSSSAGSVAHRLLEEMPDSFRGKRRVTLMHRSPLRLFYDSPEHAEADGYTAFSAKDICPQTRRVFRLSGLRADARTLFKPCDLAGVRSAHQQLDTFDLATASANAVRDILESSDLIVSAVGYSPQLLPIETADGAVLSSRCMESRRVFADEQCRVLDLQERALEGLFALGLAIGSKRGPNAGGEQGFSGQVNSLWLWQNTLGLQVAQGCIARSQRATSADWRTDMPERSKNNGSTSRTPLPFPQEHPRPLPIIQARPPKLSEHAEELANIERSGIYSNYGPVSARLEKEFVARMFRTGDCLTVCNATIGLMTAIRAVTDGFRSETKKYALMPSFTFAAAAQAAMWCGLTPLFCDIDESTWLPGQASEEALLDQYAGQIALLLPCATFGNNLDLHRYQMLSRLHAIPVVVDAAASLGSLDGEGCAFGSGFPWPVVYSMHATKLFSVGEGGLIYCGDAECIKQLRQMGNFGFTQPRSAGMLGLNSKMSEVAALTALLKLGEFDTLVRQREDVTSWYTEALGSGFPLQKTVGKRQVKTFASVLLPHAWKGNRTKVMEELQAQGIGTAAYFSPHLAEQPLFRASTPLSSLPVTDDVSSRVLNLPIVQGMSRKEVVRVAKAFTLCGANFDSASLEKRKA